MPSLAEMRKREIRWTCDLCGQKVGRHEEVSYCYDTHTPRPLFPVAARHEQCAIDDAELRRKALERWRPKNA